MSDLFFYFGYIIIFHICTLTLLFLVTFCSIKYLLFKGHGISLHISLNHFFIHARRFFHFCVMVSGMFCISLVSTVLISLIPFITFFTANSAYIFLYYVFSSHVCRGCFCFYSLH